MKSSSGRISFKSSMWVMMLYIPFSLIFILIEPSTLEKGNIPCLLHTFYIDFKIPSTMGTSSHLGRALPHSLNSLNSLFFAWHPHNPFSWKAWRWLCHSACSDNDMPHSFQPLCQHQYAYASYGLLVQVLCLRLTKVVPTTSTHLRRK